MVNAITSLEARIYYFVLDDDGSPLAYLLSRIDSISGIEISSDAVDASAVEDYDSRYVNGRADMDAQVNVTFNMTDETVSEWSDVIEIAWEDLEPLVFEIVSPYLNESYFFEAMPPQRMPMPSLEQNAVMKVTMPLTLTRYLGFDTPEDIVERTKIELEDGDILETEDSEAIIAERIVASREIQ